MVYKKKDKEEVRIIQSSNEQKRILEMCHESCMLSLSLTDTLTMPGFVLYVLKHLY